MWTRTEVCFPTAGGRSLYRYGFALEAHIVREQHLNIKSFDLEFELITCRGRLNVNWCAFRRKHRIVPGSQPIIQAELHSMLKQTFCHSSVGKLVYFSLRHSG